MDTFGNFSHLLFNMKHSLYFFLACSLFSAALQAQTSPIATYITDLNQATPEKLTVTVVPAKDLPFPVRFAFPKMVPGTYAVYDFGRFVDTLWVYEKGQRKGFGRADINGWQFLTRPDSFAYVVRPTWTDRNLMNFVFQPAGTNFEPGKNFVFNNHGIFGYFKGHEARPIRTDVTMEPGFYPATSKPFTQLKQTASFQWKDYHEAVDSPIMFSVPDTVTVQVGNAKVLIAVYNPSKAITASLLTESLQPVLMATRDFLEGELPVDRYAFILYLPDVLTSPAAGALEHNQSSFYFLPNLGKKQMGEMVRDVGAHEFFHILTPLNLHAEQIHYFDYDAPAMSEHLWLYEGVTEYNAGLVQIRHGLMNEEEWMKWIKGKVAGAAAYKENLAFTTMSRGALDEHKEQYGNVYQKGALIGMCLDMVLISSTDGRVSLRSLMKELSTAFGPEKPFKDEDLFPWIGRLGSAQAQKFLQTYVAGDAALPVDSMLQQFGYQIQRQGTLVRPHPGFKVNALSFNRGKNRWYLSSESDLYPEGKKAGFKAGDEITQVGTVVLNARESLAALNTYLRGLKPGEPVAVEVIRTNKKQKEKKKTLQVVVGSTNERTGMQVISVAQPTPQMLKWRKAWIGL